MKVERNKVNIDQTSQKAHEITKDLPPVMKNFDKEKSWGTILAKMSSMDKKVLTWTLAMAASLSMVIASNFVNWEMGWELLESEPSEQIVTNTRPEIHQISEMKGIPHVNDSQMSPIQNIEMDDLHRPIEGDLVEVYQPYENTKIVSHDMSETPSMVRPYATFGYQQGFAPEFGFDVSVWKKQQPNTTKRIIVGLSSQFVMTSSETGDSNIQPFAFLNVGYENIRADHKSWMTRASILLNPDSNHYEDHTLRLSVQKNITKHLRLGPELIFTNNFSRVYPGISLTLI